MKTWNFAWFFYNGTQYIYITNISGDVMEIADSTGNLIAQYTYDEWGKEISITADSEYQALANLNPLRYRGYYYDSETDYYYLQSRYYDPTICRFINADLPEYAQAQKNATVGINLFTYCCNDSVNNSDPSGKIAVKLISAAVSGLISGLFDIIVQGIVYQFKNHGRVRGFRINKKSLIVSITQGVACGLLMATRYKRLIQGVGSGVIAAVGTAVKMYKTNKFSTVLKASLIDFAIAAIIAFMCGNGVGTKFWSKDFKKLFGKGQYIYLGVKISNGKNGVLITGSLKLVKPVVKELCINLIKYLVGTVAYSIQSTLRTVFKGK